MKKWTLIIDIAKCHNCNNCLMACKDEHVGNDWSPIAAAQPQHGHYWMHLNRLERGGYPLVDAVYMPQPCQHCDDPSCLKAAKDGAVYKREDGIVIIDPEKSKGQMDLVDSCPYGAIYWNKELAIPQKCTMCAHLLDDGWTTPRCVQACPTGALSFVAEDVSTDPELAAFKPEQGTSPKVRYKNLHRYTTSLFCGSVALADLDECAENAVVKLSSAGKEIAETTTNNYGDFYFDGMPPDGGSYTINVSQEGRSGKSLDFETTGSINLGVIYL